MVQWFRALCALTAGAVASMPDQGIKIRCVSWCGQINKYLKTSLDLKKKNVKKNVIETPYCMTSFFHFCVFKKSCENFISMYY